MTSITNTHNHQTPPDKCLDSTEPNRIESNDHPKNLYVSPADFEWLLHYLEEDDN